MGNKLIVLAYLIFCGILFGSACKSRKVQTDLAKVSAASVTSSNLDYKSNSIDLSTIFKTGSEKNYSVTVKETFAPSADTKQPLTRETIYSKIEKQTSEKTDKNVIENKALHVKKDSSGAMGAEIKSKSVQAKGNDFGAWIACGCILVVLGTLAIVWNRLPALGKKIHDNVMGWMMPV